jgi:MutL protein
VERAAADPGYLPADPAPDLRLAALAARIAARRHGRPQTPGGAPRPLRDVGLLVGSGGVLRHHPGAVDDVLGPLTRDHAGGWAVPERARVVVDLRYVLFAAGLLAGVAPEAAVTLAAEAAQGTIGG